MHMADALLTPAVGGAMWAASAGTIACCSGKLHRQADDRKVPLMGVLGAFLFAAQMINFTIPATGSSGHLGGGLLVAILLGPSAAFLTIASVLVVQAMFFADGGLLALGCNIFNIGFIPAFIVYPLIYKKLIGTNPGKTKLITVTMISAIACLQMGSLSVVLETWLSGISSLPFSTFVLLMQPIHLAIGVIEGLITVAVTSFVSKARPDILQCALEARPIGRRPVKSLVLPFLMTALFAGGIVSCFASKNPDRLEWAIAKATGKRELKGPEQGLHRVLGELQEKRAFMPDYSFKKPVEARKNEMRSENGATMDKGGRLGTTVAGLLGTCMVLALAYLGGSLLSNRKRAL